MSNSISIDKNLMGIFNSVINKRVNSDLVNMAAQIAYNTVKESVASSKTINDFILSISYPIGVTSTSSIALYQLLSSGIKSKQRFTDSGVNEMLKYSISETKKMKSDDELTKAGMSWYTKEMDQDKAKNAALYELFYAQACSLILLDVFCNISSYFSESEKQSIYSDANTSINTLMSSVTTNAKTLVDRFYAENN